MSFTPIIENKSVTSILVSNPEVLPSPRLTLHKVFALNFIRTEAGSHRMLNPDVIADETNEAIKLPTIPDDYVLLIGDLSQPGNLRWYRKSSTQDSQKAQTKREDLLTENGRKLEEQDRVNLFYGIVIPANREALIEEIKAGTKKMFSYSRFKQNQTNGKNLNKSIEQVSIAAEINQTELGL
jgi:hypothetical protein